MLDLSIIIVSYNNINFLKDCLSSIYSSTHKATFEILFIDNCSADKSVEFVKQNFPEVKIIQDVENLGFCRGNNKGLKVYQGRYALLLNTDTIVKDAAFDRCLEFMDQNPKAGASGPKLLNPDGTPQHQGGIFNRRFWLSSVPVKVDYLIGACLLVRREVIDKVGGMDENFFFSNDDLDWCRRIKKAGWDIFFLPQAEVMHYGGYTIKLFNQKLFVEGFRGGLYFTKKHYGNIFYQLYRFLLALFMLIATFFSLLFYPFLKNKLILGAFWQIFLICLKGELTLWSKDKRLLLVSNGHAEDLAAAAIGSELRRIHPKIEISALPLVGLGKAYDKQGIQNLGLRKILPSGGFAKEGFVHFLRDLWAGLIGQFLSQIKLLRQLSPDTELIVGVGDAYLVALCGFFAKRPLIFIDGPKSVKITGYWPLEIWLMRKYCSKIIVQDKETADFLIKKGLPAFYLGSWVMDYVAVTGNDFGIGKDKTVIGILPGTREEAYENLRLILDLLANLPDQNYVGLIASTLDNEKLRSLGLLDKIEKSPFPIRIVEGKFGDVCVRSMIIIGMAGIANEQAAAFGKPVICFPGTGPQTTRRRWQEIQKITGDSMRIIDGNSQTKAEQIYTLLNNQPELERMAEIGKTSKANWGAIARIAALIYGFNTTK